MTKVQKLIEKAHIISPGEPASKNVKPDDFSNDNDEHDPTWLSITGCLLTASDKAVLLQNEMLNDKHIYFSQRLLLNQFPNTKVYCDKGPSGLGSIFEESLLSICIEPF